MEKFHDMEGLLLNPLEIPVENQYMEKFPIFGSSTSHTVYFKTIDVRK